MGSISLDEEITEAALALFEKFGRENECSFTGVTIDNLEPYEEQVSLFDNKEELKKRNRTIDELKKRFGEGIIGRGSSFAGKEGGTGKRNESLFEYREGLRGLFNRWRVCRDDLKR